LRRIDLIGANGVGKSTLYSHLIERRRGHDLPWLTLGEAKRKIAVRGFVKEMSPRDLIKAFSCHLPLVGDAFVDAYCRRRAEHAFATDREGYQRFFDRCMRHFDSAEPAGTASCLSLVWLFSRVAETALLEKLSETVIFDESLSHKVVTLLSDNQGLVRNGQGLKTYLDTMPAPEAVIHLSAPDGLIMQRLIARERRRGSPIARHLTLDRKGLYHSIRRTREISETLASHLQSRGGDVIHLDAGKPPELNAEIVEEFLARQ
jgi:hypothetical protein